MKKLLNEGDISTRDQEKFYAGVRAFYIGAASQALRTLPFNYTLLDNAKFCALMQKKNVLLNILVSNLLQLTPVYMDRLQDDFTETS